MIILIGAWSNPIKPDVRYDLFDQLTYRLIMFTERFPITYIYIILSKCTIKYISVIFFSESVN